MTAALVAAGAMLCLVLVARSEGAKRYRLVRRALWLRQAGRSAAAVKALEAAIDVGRPDPGVVNLAVETLISGGKYSEALALPPAFDPVAPFDKLHFVLVQINLAEAEYNLGRWDAAWSRLEPLDGRAEPFAITRAGLALQRAWILAHTNRPDEALAMWEQADMYGLPHPYRAEHYFTHAAILLGLGRLDDAEDVADAGADASVRPSSERNALFMLARVAATKGDLERAEELCRAASGHRFQGHGGDGLLLWGDVLNRLHRATEARQAYALCIARDGQSESARSAEARLRATTIQSAAG